MAGEDVLTIDLDSCTSILTGFCQLTACSFTQANQESADLVIYDNNICFKLQSRNRRDLSLYSVVDLAGQWRQAVAAVRPAAQSSADGVDR